MEETLLQPLYQWDKDRWGGRTAGATASSRSVYYSERWTTNRARSGNWANRAISLSHYLMRWTSAFLAALLPGSWESLPSTREGQECVHESCLK